MHPILLRLGGLTFPSYGAAMVLAFLVGWLVVRRRGRQIAPEVD